MMLAKRCTPIKQSNLIQYTCFFLCLFFFVQPVQGQKPVINSVAPLKGAVGSTVTISGQNFSPIAANNIVYFGDVKAPVTAATANTLTVMVPPGATYRPLSVTVGGMTTYGTTPFAVTFPGGSAGFAPYSFSPKTDSAFTILPSALATTDLDGDGRLDVILGGSNDRQITVLKNTSTIGAIGFARKAGYRTDTVATNIVSGDLDGDGKLDVITVNTRANSLSVFQNSSSADTILLSLKLTLKTGRFPVICAVADIDQDGKPDLLCTNRFSDSLSIFRNTSSAAGSLSFAEKLDIAVGRDPIGLVVTDLDSDGVAEVVIATPDDNAIAIFRNRSTPGTIRLDAKVVVQDSFKPAQLMAADMDGDGRPDLVASSETAALFWVLKNKSATSTFAFAPVQFFPTGFGASPFLSVADADGDGRPDVAVNHFLYDQVSLIKNLSRPDTLSFANRVDFRVADNTAALLLADLDNDSRPDLLAANNGISGLSFFRNLVTKPHIGSFTPTAGGNGAVVTITGDNFTEASAVQFGGVAAKSFVVESPNLITAVVDSGTSGEVLVVTPYGTARAAGFTFNRTPTILSFTPTKGGSGTMIAITGTNFNGTTSVTIGGVPAGSFTVLSPTLITATVGQLPPGNFGVAVTSAAGTATFGSFYTGVTVQSFYPTSGPVGTKVTIRGTHFNPVPSKNTVHFGSVLVPVLSATATSLEVVVPPGINYQPVSVATDSFVAYADRGFLITFNSNPLSEASFTSRVDSASGSYPIHATLTDLDNDGKPDVVSGDFALPSFSISKNRSNKGVLAFYPQMKIATATRVQYTAAGDLNGDGRQDLVVLSTERNLNLRYAITVFRNATTTDSIVLVKSDHDIGIQNSHPEYALITDFDGDGKADVALLTYSELFVLKNTGTGDSIRFAPKLNVPRNGYAGNFISRDVDGDGKPDLVVSDSYERVTFYRNISAFGNIQFAPKMMIETGSGPLSLGFGDMDGDGRLDMAVVNRGSNNVSIFKNNSTSGTISFGTRIGFQLGITPENVDIGDLDGDGRPDMVVAIGTQPISFFALRNTSANGAISFSEPIAFASSFGHGRIAIGDMNDDGKPDLLTTRGGAGNFSVFVNQSSTDDLAALITASGPTVFCTGSSVILKTPAQAGATYQWLKDSVAIAAATDSVFTAAATGRYSVAVSLNGNTIVSPVINVGVRPLPQAPQISLKGNGGTLCAGSGALLQASAGGTLQWYRNDVAISGSTDSVYRATAPGNYKVVATNDCAASSSNVISVTSAALAAVTIAAGDNSFCAGDSARLTANATAGVSFQWNINEEPIPGATGPVLAVPLAGQFSVTAETAGCRTVSPAVAVTVKPAPARPAITASGSALRSSSAMGNQWFREGVAINGAVQQTYQPASNGKYTVQVTQNGCISPLSEEYAYVLTSIVSIDNRQFVKLAPNPVRQRLSLAFKLQAASQLNLDLFDINGRLVGQWRNLKDGATIDVSTLPAAVYVAKLHGQNNNLTVTMKVIKQ